jgi:putative transposase/transposase-like zinc-binding protein
MCQLLQRPALQLGDILRLHGPAYAAGHPVSPEQGKVLRRLAACRTAALGGHLDACGACGFTRVSYNSCRDRHCPRCQASKRAEWLETRLERLLPVPYFHVVFTVPDLLYPLMLHNQRRLYDLLFRTAAATLLTLAADPSRLDAQIGITALLHTWGQNLLFHPHLHCVVTGGGLSPDGQRWLACKPRFFLPVKVLGKLFRGKFLAGLKEAYQAGLLSLDGSVAALADPKAFGRLLDACYGRNWVVYAKPPFGGPEQVFRYLGRYSHRVAISNSRLRGLDDTHVAFDWKDYADDHQTKVMRLAIDEFIRRFLLHVLPKGFVRIRHYGLLASVNVATRLEHCRRLLGSTDKPTAKRPAKTWFERVREWTGLEPMRCPQCQGPLTRHNVPPSRSGVGTVAAPSPAVQASPQAAAVDSS